MSNDSTALFRVQWDALQKEVLHLAKRDCLSVRILSGTKIPLDTVNTTAAIIDGLGDWIAQHAQVTESFEVSLDNLEPTPPAKNIVDAIWQHLRRFYQYHLQHLTRAHS